MRECFPKKRLRSGTSLAIQVLVMLALFVWQVQKLLARKPCALRNSAMDSFGEHGLWPFRVVSAIFHIQFIVCLTSCLFMFPVLRFGKDSGRGEMFFLSQMQRSSAVIGVVGLMAALEYHYLGRGDKIRIGEGSWFGVPEPRIADRYMMWAILAPFEWLPYVWLYTVADPSELCKIMVQTAIMCLLGSAAILHDEHVLEGEGQHACCAISLSLFVAACIVFAALLKRVAALPLEPVTRSMQRKCLRFLVVMWSAYPVLNILRTFGFMTAWTEQVLLITFFDVMAKCVLHMFCWTGPLCQLWVSALGNLQIAHSRADCNLTVESESWTLAPSAGCSDSAQEHLLGSDSKGSSFLKHVMHEDQRQAIERAASHVDKDANKMAQKLLVDLRLSGGRAGKAEILIARNLYGRRQIALTLLEETCASTTTPGCSTDASSSLGAAISMHRLDSQRYHGGEAIIEEHV